MTQKEFYEVLSTIRGWTLHSGFIRRQTKKFDQCPITAVCYKLKRKYPGCGDYENAARVLNLRLSTAKKIAHESDGDSGKQRSRLLRACRLQEEKQ